MRELRRAFQSPSGKFLFLLLLLILVALLSGCPEGGEGGAEGAEGAGDAPTAAEAPADAPEGAEAAEEADDGASQEAADSATDDSASETTGDALRVAQEDAENASEEPSHFLVRINEDGEVEAVDELGFKSDTVGQLSRDGQLWEVNRAGDPIRPVARIRGNQLWEVDRGGNPIKAIGRLRATIQGTTAIDIYAQPGADFGKLGAIQPGDVIEILNSREDWLFIRQPDSGVEGWIQSSIPYVSSDKDKKDAASE